MYATKRPLPLCDVLWVGGTTICSVIGSCNQPVWSPSQLSLTTRYFLEKKYTTIKQRLEVRKSQNPETCRFFKFERFSGHPQMWRFANPIFFVICGFAIYLKREFFRIFSFNVRYSTLLHMPQSKKFTDLRFGDYPSKKLLICDLRTEEICGFVITFWAPVVADLRFADKKKLAYRPFGIEAQNVYQNKNTTKCFTSVIKLHS